MELLSHAAGALASSLQWGALQPGAGFSVTLQTTRVGTFTATTVKSGAPLVWIDDQGNSYVGNTPSFVYGSAGTKTITLTSADGWGGLTSFTCANQALTRMVGFESWTSITTFDVNTNAALAFNIAVLADWRPNDFRAHNTSISGNIAALSNWRPTDFRVNNTSISGDIASLANWRPTAFQAQVTSISGDIASLADWRPTAFWANNTSISGNIAALSNWRPTTFFANTTSISGDIAALSNWRPTTVQVHATSISGDIASLADWRPNDFRIYSTSISGDIASLADWRPATFFQAQVTSISGDIAALSNWRTNDFRIFSTQITCSGAGGAQMAANANLSQYLVQSTQIDTTGINAIVVDLWTYRTNGAGLTINISNVPGVLSADSVARIEGTGAYAGDGIKTYGATITYTAP